MAQGLRRPERHSRQSSRVTSLTGRKPVHDGPQSTHSDKATTDYIKRVLCARQSENGLAVDPTAVVVDDRPLDELLPSLTSSKAVDVQLYALIAVILELFVQTWYRRITPDQGFVHETVRIIAHCTRKLEQRLQDTDLERLVVDELPALLHAHINGMRPRFQLSFP
jgi:hypothetical protein